MKRRWKIALGLLGLTAVVGVTAPLIVSCSSNEVVNEFIDVTKLKSGKYKLAYVHWNGEWNNEYDTWELMYNDYTKLYDYIKAKGYNVVVSIFKDN